MITENVNRIKDMEKRMRRARKVLKSMEYALDEWDLVNSDIKVLNKYLGSDEWKADLKADEEGLLPTKLRRGVLSEDGIWDVVDTSRELNCQMLEIVATRMRRENE